MAKISLTKLTPIKTIDNKVININGENVSIIQYLPITEKAKLVSDVLGDTLDEHGMNSNIRENVYTGIRLIQYYTNINITENMLNNSGKTYDLLMLNNIIDQVKENIPKEELDYIIDAIRQSINIVSEYRTSIAGLFTDMQAGNQDSVRSADELMNQLNEVSQNGLLRNILEKMG